MFPLLQSLVDSLTLRLFLVSCNAEQHFYIPVRAQLDYSILLEATYPQTLWSEVYPKVEYKSGAYRGLATENIATRSGKTVPNLGVLCSRRSSVVIREGVSQTRQLRHDPVDKSDRNIFVAGQATKRLEGERSCCQRVEWSNRALYAAINVTSPTTKLSKAEAWLACLAVRTARAPIISSTATQMPNGIVLSIWSAVVNSYCASRGSDPSCPAVKTTISKAAHEDARNCELEAVQAASQTCNCAEMNSSPCAIPAMSGREAEK